MSEFHNPTMEEEELVPLISANVSASIEPASGSLYRYEVADIHRTEDKKIFMCFDVNKETKTIDLIKYGVVHAWNELETIRQDLSIRPRRVLVDSGDQTTTVYKQCGLRGEWVKTKTGNIRWSSWIPCKGREGRDDFKHIKDGVGRFYSPPSPKDTGINEDGKRQIGLCLFATDAVKDIADDLLKKKHHEWTLRIPETAANDDVLIKSLNSEKLEKVENKRRGGYDERWVRKSDFNHYFDCLCLLIVGMGKDHLI